MKKLCQTGVPMFRKQISLTARKRSGNFIVSENFEILSKVWKKSGKIK